MGLVLGWIFFSFIIGFVGSNRKIGFLGAFFLSLLLSPLIGLIFTLTSKNIEDEKYKDELLRTVKQQQNDLNSLLGYRDITSETNFKNEELKKLKKLRDYASITEEEYQYRKERLMNS